MRKTLSVLLLAVFGFLLVSPLLALGTTANGRLMACCRRDGRHHCAETMLNRSPVGDAGIHLAAPPERCPFAPVGIVGAHVELSGVAQTATPFALLVAHPSGVPQTECRWRIARDRSRQKRGPPVPSVL